MAWSIKKGMGGRQLAGRPDETVAIALRTSAADRAQREVFRAWVRAYQKTEELGALMYEEIFAADLALYIAGQTEQRVAA
jgi:hypothetical protein